MAFKMNEEVVMAGDEEVDAAEIEEDVARILVDAGMRRGTEGEDSPAKKRRPRVPAPSGRPGSLTPLPSPVSGTEPDTAKLVREAHHEAMRAHRREDEARADTAKLVEALRELMAETKAYLEPVGSYANPAMHQARDALAGFSVDAGKPEER